jgi:uncharacterized membrane protein YkoI
MAIAALIVPLLVPAHAGGAVRPPHPKPAGGYACLNHKERRAANESGKIIHLATAIRSARKRMPGAVVRARLCRGREGLVYVLTVLARNGKVARLTVDAIKGTVVGIR